MTEFKIKLIHIPTGDEKELPPYTARTEKDAINELSEQIGISQDYKMETIKIKKFILLGDPIQKLEEVEFNNEDELNAFMRGLDLGYGWHNYESMDTKEEVKDHLRNEDTLSDFTEDEINEL